MKTILNFIVEHWETVSVLFYELIARLFPTKKNLSLFDKIWVVINYIIPNFRKKTGNEKGVDVLNNTNIIEVPINKHILK